MKIIDELTAKNQYSRALGRTIRCIKEHPIDGEHKFMYRDFAFRLINIIQVAKRIQPETKKSLEEIYSCLAGSDKEMIEKALASLPLFEKEEPQTMSGFFDLKPLPEDVI